MQKNHPMLQSSSNVGAQFALPTRKPTGSLTQILLRKDRRLAQQTKLLKERNASLLRAMGSVRANPSSSTVYVPGAGDE
jgi:phosphoribosyl-dephospho-CoA transferase